MKTGEARYLHGSGNENQIGEVMWGEGAIKAEAAKKKHCVAPILGDRSRAVKQQQARDEGLWAYGHMNVIYAPITPIPLDEICRLIGIRRDEVSLYFER